MKYATAKTILRQLGSASVMLGAKNIVLHEDGVSFRIGKNSKRVNRIRITLDPSDTYSISFDRVPSVKAFCAGKEVKSISSAHGVYVDNLHDVIEHHTGLYTRL